MSAQLCCGLKDMNNIQNTANPLSDRSAHYHPVHSTIRVDKDQGLKQIEADSFQSKLSVHTTEFNLD